jgi:hypothetical protein
MPTIRPEIDRAVRGHAGVVSLRLERSAARLVAYVSLGISAQAL